MNDLTAGADTPAAEVVQTEATVETSDATTEQPATETAAEQPEADNGDDAPAQPKKKHWAHERIDELTRQKRDFERQAEYWKARAEKTVDPDTLDYEDGIAERVAQRTRQEQADTASESAKRVAFETFQLREAEAKERYPDYDAVTRNQNVPISQSMADLIMDSDLGPEIAYHLGKNPSEAAKLAALPATQMAREMGRLEARLSAPKAAPKQPAEPVRPVSAINAGGPKSPEGMSMAEYVAWRNGNK